MKHLHRTTVCIYIWIGFIWIGLGIELSVPHVESKVNTTVRLLLALALAPSENFKLFSLTTSRSILLLSGFRFSGNSSETRDVCLCLNISSSRGS